MDLINGNLLHKTSNKMSSAYIYTTRQRTKYFAQNLNCHKINTKRITLLRLWKQTRKRPKSDYTGRFSAKTNSRAQLVLAVIKPRDQDGNAELKEPEYGTRRGATGFFEQFLCFVEASWSRFSLHFLALFIVIFEASNLLFNAAYTFGTIFLKILNYNVTLDAETQP